MENRNDNNLNKVKQFKYWKIILVIVCLSSLLMNYVQYKQSKELSPSVISGTFVYEKRLGQPSTYAIVVYPDERFTMYYNNQLVDRGVFKEKEHISNSEGDVEKTPLIIYKAETELGKSFEITFVRNLVITSEEGNLICYKRISAPNSYYGTKDDFLIELNSAENN